MKKIGLFLIITVCVVGMSSTHARDSRLMFSVDESLNNESAKAKLDGSVRFYFGDQQHPKVLKRHGEFMSNKKTNAFNKSDKRACEWAFLSAMLSFQDRARREGGNAVVNIRSYYKKHTVSSETEYECGAGAVIAGVTFLGDVVTLAR